MEGVESPPTYLIFSVYMMVKVDSSGVLLSRSSDQGAVSCIVICSQKCGLSGDTAGLCYYLLGWPTPWIL